MNRPEKGEGFPGQRIVVLPRSVVARAQKDSLMIGLLPTDVGYFPAASGHLRERTAGVDQVIFIYCVGGSGWCEMNGRYHAIKRGELLVVSPNVPHAYGADEARPWSIYWFHAKGSLVSPLLRELEITVDRPVVRIGEKAQLLALFEEVLEVLEQGYLKTQLFYASQALAHLIAVMIRDHRGAIHENPSSSQKIMQSIDYMKQRLNQSLHLGAVARIANLSRSQYVVLFKRQTGYAPMDYFTRLRMHRACQLLDNTELSVKQVAAELGYEDPLYFSRVFRSVSEQTPTEYRKTRKG